MTRLFVLALVALFFISKSGWHEVGSIWLHAATQVGIVMAAIGALGRLWCSSYAGGNKNEILLQVGPYSLSRNPLYCFSYIGGLGIAATTETFAIPLLFTLWFAWYYHKVIRGEELFLGHRFGQAYVQYQATVPRFVPRRRGFEEPARWDMSPPAFRASLTEVVWFVVAAVGLHAIHDMRSSLGFPALFHLY